MGPVNNSLASMSSSKIQSQPDYIYSVQSALHSSERVYAVDRKALHSWQGVYITELTGGLQNWEVEFHGEGGGKGWGRGGHTSKENSVSRREKCCSSDGPTVNTRSTDENNQPKQILVDNQLFKPL